MCENGTCTRFESMLALPMRCTKATASSATGGASKTTTSAPWGASNR